MNQLPVAPRHGSTDPVRAQVANELLERAHAERAELAELPQREQVLLAAWLASLRSLRTRRAYSGDLLSWLADRLIEQARQRATPVLIDVLRRYPVAPTAGNRVAHLMSTLDAGLRASR